MSWSSVVSRSCWNTNDSSSSGANSWKSSSNRHRTARASRNHHRRKGPRPGRRSCQFMVLQPLRGSIRGCLLPSRPSQGEQTVWWRLPVPCAPLQTPRQRSWARFIVSRESLSDSFEIGDRGRISAPLARMKPERRVEVIPVRPGPGGRWMMTGDSPPLLTCFCVMGGSSRLSRNSSGASRRAQRRRWRTGAPVRSAFEPPPIHQSPISLWMI